MTVKPDQTDLAATASAANSARQPAAPGVSRKELLRRAGFGVGALAVGAAVPAAPALASSLKSLTILSKSPEVVLGFGGGTCEAPLFAAYTKGFFKDEGLNVTLLRTSTGLTSAQEIDTGKFQGAPGILFSYLKPIEQGSDIKLTAGLHGNCIRLIVSKASGIKKAADLKGKTIGVGAIGDSAMSFFSLLLAKNGINPSKDITWKQYAPTLISAAFDKGEIQAAAVSDPFGYLLIRDKKGFEAGTNILGLFGNTAGITPHRFCCTIGLSGKLVRDNPKEAAAVTRAWIKGSHWAGAHTHETSLIETNKQTSYVAIDQPSAELLLNSYIYNPSATLVKQDIYIGAKNFQLTGYLDPNTDPNKLAATTYADVFQLAGEPAPQ